MARRRGRRCCRPRRRHAVRQPVGVAWGHTEPDCAGPEGPVVPGIGGSVGDSSSRGTGDRRGPAGFHDSGRLVAQRLLGGRPSRGAAASLPGGGIGARRNARRVLGSRLGRPQTHGQLFLGRRLRARRREWARRMAGSHRRHLGAGSRSIRQGVCPSIGHRSARIGSRHSIRRRADVDGVLRPPDRCPVEGTLWSRVRCRYLCRLSVGSCLGGAPDDHCLHRRSDLGQGSVHLPLRQGGGRRVVTHADRSIRRSRRWMWRPQS